MRKVRQNGNFILQRMKNIQTCSLYRLINVYLSQNTYFLQASMMKVPYIILLLLFLSAASALHAENIPTDTLLAHFYDRAATLMGEGYYEEAQRSFDSAFAVRGVEQSPVYPILLNEQATLLIYTGENERAFEMKKQVLPYLPHMDDLEKHISVYNDLAILYRQRHMNDSTLHYYNKALEAALQYKDEGWITHIYNNVSILYFNIRRLDEAEKYTDLAAEHAAKTDDPFSTFSAWQLRAGIKAELNKTDEAELSIRKAWETACRAGENATAWKMRCMPSLLRVFERQGQPDSVEHYLQMGNRMLAEIPANSIPAIGFIQVRASAEMNRKNYARALKDFLWLREKNVGSEPKTLLTQIAQCYNATGNRQQAYAYMDSARMWTDTLAQRNLTEQMAEFNVKYQTQEKELQIARLQQEKLEHQTLLLKTAVSAGCLLTVALVAVLLLYYRKRMAEKKIRLLEQENELHSAQRYIEGMEEECKYFAKELHDGIANDLLGIQMKIEASAGETPFELSEMIRQIHDNVRNISHKLMPPEFEQLSLNDILKYYAQFQTQNSLVRTSYEADPSDSIGSRTAREIYRIVQEVNTNILKHSKGVDSIEISLRSQGEGRYELRIADNGRQTKTNSQEDQGEGIGLRTVKDRAKAIGGSIHAQSSAEGNLFVLQFNVRQNG